MQINLTTKEFRHLLDMVYIGNWVLNSTRGDDRFAAYDDLESKLFELCREHKMGILTEDWNGIPVPSKAYVEGGIHEAIAFYEDNVFFQISIHTTYFNQLRKNVKWFFLTSGIKMGMTGF